MKIKHISCSQFGGLMDRSESFSDGLNVIYGKNESGKSTLVNLISRTLFQNARLHKAMDKEFLELYFPAGKKGGGKTGDFIDGKITIETEEGSYTLSKEWSSDPRCMLQTPDGIVRDQDSINAILKDILLYGEGVYSELLFSSQRNTDRALQILLDTSKKTDMKDQLTTAVSQAFAESDGITADAVLQAVQDKIDEIVGKHWNIERNAPEKKRGGGRWVKELGDIGKAYYGLEDAQNVQKEIAHLEEEADRATREYTDQDMAVQAAQTAYDSFQTYAGRLSVQKNQKALILNIEKELTKMEKVLADWPDLKGKLETAGKLQREQKERELVDRYEAVKKVYDQVKDLEKTLEGMPCPQEAEIDAVKTAQRRISSLENKLCGMNLTASVHMLAGHQIKILSVRTGQPMNLSQDPVSISEAVKIQIPDVMEMELSPADVDVVLVSAQLQEKRQLIREIFDKYSVESLEELEKQARSFSENRLRLETGKRELTGLLGGAVYEELAAEADRCALVRTKKEIEQDLCDLCGSRDIDRYITAKETVAEGYVSEYGSIETLIARYHEQTEKLKKEKSAAAGVEDIPEAYRQISDPDIYLSELQEALKKKQRLRETALTEKTACVSRLESYKENIQGDPAEEEEKAERLLEEQKALLNHWLHIREVCKEEKEKIRENPMLDIARGFSHYLGVISAEKVSSEFPEEDKLDMQVYSNDRLMDYGKLSEGTKETVSLAFRLAVLDHLFPEGGGVIVFDDPFTDMDEERTAQACSLIKECAKRHQVIFLTCKEEYADLIRC